MSDKGLFANPATNFYEKDKLFLHYQAKLISTPLDGEVQVMTDKDILHFSDVVDSRISNSKLLSTGLTKSESTNSLLIQSKVISAHLSGANIIDSKIVSSKVFDSVIHSSEVTDSTVVRDSTVTNSNIIKTTLIGKCFVDEAVIENCTLRGAVVEAGVKLSGLIGLHQPYFKHGFWERMPYYETSPDLRYDVTEDVNDRILIGCQSRSVGFWLSLTKRQALKLGPEFDDNFYRYRHMVERVAAYKSLNPSPETLDIKPDDVLYSDLQFE